MLLIATNLLVIPATKLNPAVKIEIDNTKKNAWHYAIEINKIKFAIPNVAQAFYQTCTLTAGGQLKTTALDHLNIEITKKYKNEFEKNELLEAITAFNNYAGDRNLSIKRSGHQTHSTYEISEGTTLIHATLTIPSTSPIYKDIAIIVFHEGLVYANAELLVYRRVVNWQLEGIPGRYDYRMRPALKHYLETLNQIEWLTTQIAIFRRNQYESTIEKMDLQKEQLKNERIERKRLNQRPYFASNDACNN
jgi:hypothetical protein